VTFVTGHSSDGAAPNGVDWEAIARGSPVIVLYMGLRQLHVIAARLIAAGRPPEEPVAIVSKATTPAQRVLMTSLAEAAAAAAQAVIEGPTIIAIGEVVRLHAALDWLGDPA
jgi:uroporphyrin-III C-methyltransferase